MTVQPTLNLQGMTREPNPQGTRHEVFLSHSGHEKRFVDDLFTDLVRLPRFRSNEPFFDTQDASLRKGEEFVTPIIEAARNCAVAVMVLTKEYLTSYWPMLELLHFIDAKRTTNPDMKLLPVFYGDLLPSHLGEQAIKDRWEVEWEKIISQRSSQTSSSRRVSLTVESCQKALKILKNSNGIEMWKYKTSRSQKGAIVDAILKFLPASCDPEINPDIEGGRRLCDVSH